MRRVSVSIAVLVLFPSCHGRHGLAVLRKALDGSDPVALRCIEIQGVCFFGHG